MKIAFDCRVVRDDMTGVGRYTWRLAMALLRSGSGHDIHLFFGPGESSSRAEDARREGGTVHAGFISHEAHPWCDAWEQTALPIRLAWGGFDLFVSGIFQIPWWTIGTLRVFVVHDMIAFLYPDTMSRRFAAYSRFQTRMGCWRAHGIIANSENTSRDLHEMVPRAKDKIAVVYAGLEGASQEVSREKGLSDRGVEGPYLLFVGTNEPRKNLSFLIDCYVDAKRRSPSLPKLVLIGKQGEARATMDEKIRANNAAESVIVLGYLEEDVLASAYDGCAFLLFPSLYEGFGYPALEAMSRGKAVIASNRGSMAEVVGSGGILLDPEDRRGWTESIVGLWENADMRMELERAATRRAGDFGWRQTSEAALMAIERWEKGHA